MTRPPAEERTKTCRGCGHEKLAIHFRLKLRTRRAKHTGETYTTGSRAPYCDSCVAEHFKDRPALERPPYQGGRS